MQKGHKRRLYKRVCKQSPQSQPEQLSESSQLSDSPADADYDSEGYDSDGYDVDGYDREGFDRSGYNLDGYDCEGYDRDGYDEDGFDRDGCYRDPFDLGTEN